MKRIIILLLLLLPLFAVGQGSANDLFVINKDSLEKRHFLPMNQNWKFMEADSAAMAGVDYDDSGWEHVEPGLYLSEIYKHKYNTFNSIGWFRLHFYADTSIAGISLALVMEQYGASELYLDGKKIKSYGVIKGKDSTEYFNPHQIPFVFIIPKAGEHVLAIRYANFDAQNNYKKYEKNFAGVNVAIGDANTLVNAVVLNMVSSGFVFTLLFGIFIALCVSHLLLYFYNKSVRSNLYFSLFCLALSVAFFHVWLCMVSTSPIAYLSNYYSIGFVTALFCFSLSAFVNELFSKKKLRFKVIAILCIACPIIYRLDTTDLVGIMLYIGLVCIVCLEATILIVVAIYRRKKGAWIIGIGFLLLSLFLLFLMIYLSIYNSIAFGNGLVAQIIFIIMGLAVLSLPISMSFYLAWSFAGVNKELKNNLEQVKELSERTIQQEQDKQRMMETQNELLELEVAARTAEVVAQNEQIMKQHAELKKEKEKSDTLLLNILPEEIAEELKEKGHSEARLYNDVTVLFTDFVDFTVAGERMSAQELVDELHVCFKTFDEISARHNIEKIKTIGDAYMAVGGLPVADANHALNAVNAAMEIMQFMTKRKMELKEKTFEVRIGIHSGSVVAGIVGIKKFAYDIWGDTVNTAARMEQNSEAGKINISQTTYDMIKNSVTCTFRGAITAKNKGALSMYFVDF